MNKSLKMGKSLFTRSSSKDVEETNDVDFLKEVVNNYKVYIKDLKVEKDLTILCNLNIQL